MSAFYVWGVGPAVSDLVRNAPAAEQWPQEALDAPALGEDEGWCVVVETSEGDVDDATRFDRAVVGWCEVRS